MVFTIHTYTQPTIHIYLQQIHITVAFRWNNKCLDSGNLLRARKFKNANSMHKKNNKPFSNHFSIRNKLFAKPNMATVESLKLQWVSTLNVCIDFHPFHTLHWYRRHNHTRVNTDARIIIIITRFGCVFCDFCDRSQWIYEIRWIRIFLSIYTHLRSMQCFDGRPIERFFTGLISKTHRGNSYRK